MSQKFDGKESSAGGVLTPEIIQEAAKKAAAQGGYYYVEPLSSQAYNMLQEIEAIEPGYANIPRSTYEIQFKYHTMGLGKK